MATISFKEDLVVTDVRKIKEIATALQQPKRKETNSIQPQKLPKNAGAIWFKRSEN